MMRRFALLWGLLSGLSAAAAAQTSLASEKLAEGVWATRTPGGANAGWFTVGDVVFAVDAGMSPEVGSALVEEIQKTTGRKPRYLLVTHAHRDHAGGAPAFAAAGAQIVSSERAAAGILSVLGEAAPSAQGKSASSKTPAGSVLMTVSERCLFVGGERRRAEIYYLGPGHTQGDLVVVLPADGILFAGDLACNGVLPYLRSPDVDPKGWEANLARLSPLKIQKMVPGHGAIGPPEGIAQTAAYLRHVDAIAVSFVLGNVPESLYEAQLNLPENAIEGVSVTPDHIANVKAVCQFEEASRAAPSKAPTPGPTPSRKP
ncbi:MAG TPA: MBL fold metallo-hydrolase [Thermoanaerobaculia bacterium]|nr:MBL fold metallo-hydrolase [Thermoanaerobaculia bacterium]